MATAVDPSGSNDTSATATPASSYRISPRLVASPSAEIGSIGVMALHEDITGMADQLGVKVTLITAGKYKAVGSEFEPLTEETEGLIQGLVDDIYGRFVASVARGRGVSVGDVKDGFGQGFIVGAKEAVSSAWLIALAPCARRWYAWALQRTERGKRRGRRLLR